MSVAEIIQICTLILTAIGLVLAGIGLNTWNYQLRGSYRFELAKSTRIAMARMGRRVSGIFHLLSSSRCGNVDDEGRLVEEINVIEFIFDDPNNLSLLGNLDELNKQFESLEDKLFECELAFPNNKISPLLYYYDAIDSVNIDIAQFRRIAESGNGLENMVTFFGKRFSTSNLKLVIRKEKAAMEYLEPYMNNPLAPQIKWNLRLRKNTVEKLKQSKT